MTDKEFDGLIENRIQSIRTVLKSKQEEYAIVSDRFHNFRVAARLENTTPMKALLGMRVKHEVSIRDLVDGNMLLSEKLIEEKIGDSINYLILLEGLLKEKLYEQNMD